MVEDGPVYHAYRDIDILPVVPRKSSLLYHVRTAHFTASRTNQTLAMRGRATTVAVRLTISSRPKCFCSTADTNERRIMGVYYMRNPTLRRVVHRTRGRVFESLEY